MGSKAIANRNPLAGQPCLTPLAVRNCPRGIPANSHMCSALGVDSSEETANELGHFCFSRAHGRSRSDER